MSQRPPEQPQTNSILMKVGDVLTPVTIQKITSDKISQIPPTSVPAIYNACSNQLTLQSPNIGNKNSSDRRA